MIDVFSFGILVWQYVYDMDVDSGLRHIDPWMKIVMWNIWLITIYDDT